MRNRHLLPWPYHSFQNTAGVDFNLPINELTFTIGETVQCVSIVIFDDTIVEDNEVFMVEVSSESDDLFPISAVIITDNDSK